MPSRSQAPTTPRDPAPGLVEQHVFDALRRDIVNLTLTPGQRLRLDRLAREYGASLTPVGQALRRLEGDGLVLSRPRRGSAVAPLTRWELELLSVIAVAAEATTVKLGTPRLTDRDLTDISSWFKGQAEARESGDIERYLAYAWQIRDRVGDRCSNPLVRAEALAWRGRLERYVRYLRHIDPEAALSMTAYQQAFVSALLARDAPEAASASSEVIALVVDRLGLRLPLDADPFDDNYNEVAGFVTTTLEKNQ